MSSTCFKCLRWSKGRSRWWDVCIHSQLVDYKQNFAHCTVHALKVPSEHAVRPMKTVDPITALFPESYCLSETVRLYKCGSKLKRNWKPGLVERRHSRESSCDLHLLIAACSYIRCISTPRKQHMVKTLGTANLLVERAHREVPLSRRSEFSACGRRLAQPSPPSPVTFPPKSLKGQSSAARRPVVLALAAATSSIDEESPEVHAR